MQQDTFKTDAEWIAPTGDGHFFVLPITALKGVIFK
jgi:hypothetical protein